MESFDVEVVGAGIVGRSLALSLARQGLRVALRSGAPQSQDGVDDVRAYALSAASVALLRGLKVWDALPAGAATPVHEMRVAGDLPGAALEFSAWEQRVGELAWIVDAAGLERGLDAALRFSPHVDPVELDAAAVAAPLTAFCDGKASAARDALGVRFERHDYGQRAVAARLVASRPHRHIARQWFRSPDVLALLPFDTPRSGASYALVWSLPDADAAELLALDSTAFEARLVDATGGEAGALTLGSKRMAWPLGLARADAWSGTGWVLLGDAAHVVHPLAGQGLNLGLADVAALSTVLAGRESWRSLGDARLLRRYARERLAPTIAMGQVTDGLLQLFVEPSQALQELRNRGLTLVNRLSPIKRWLTARALDS